MVVVTYLSPSNFKWVQTVECWSLADFTPCKQTISVFTHTSDDTTMCLLPPSPSAPCVNQQCDGAEHRAGAHRSASWCVNEKPKLNQPLVEQLSSGPQQFKLQDIPVIKLTLMEYTLYTDANLHNNKNSNTGTDCSNRYSYTVELLFQRHWLIQLR